MPHALLIDFGGVLTTSLTEAFDALGAQVGLAPGTAMTVLATDPESRQALVDHECGRLDDDGFERAYAAALGRAGAQVDPEGLIRRITSRLSPDDAMLALVRRVRAAGRPVALVSNSLGRDGYATLDLGLFEAVVISGRVGARKPSRAIYQHAADTLGVPTGECVLVDDIQRNLDGAARLGITGVLHTTAETTIPQVERLLDLDPAPTPTPTPTPKES